MTEPTFEVHLTQTLSDDERRILLGWGDDIFDVGQLDWHGRKKEWQLLGYAGGQLVSRVGVLKTVVNIAQQPMTVGGIGGVVTIPTAQRKGYARLLLQQAATFMTDTLQVEFGLLFCLPRLLPFYQRAGWQEVTSPVFIEQPAGHMASPVPMMWLACCSAQGWPAGPVEIGLPW